MGVRAIRCLLLLLGLLFCHGPFAKESGDGPSTKSSEPCRSKNPSAHQLKRKDSRVMLRPGSKLQASMKILQADVVTPIPTVPVINPTTTPTATPVTTTTPDYNPFLTPSNPTTPMLTPVTTTPSPYSGQSWCVASQTASQAALQVALDYACGYGGADCSAIQQGGTCYSPDSFRDHASYAFNIYYRRNPIPTSCDFGGTAIITNIDPSTSMCQYQSTSTSVSVLNTTNPTGSTVYGRSIPPTTSDSISLFEGTGFLVTCTCFVASSVLLTALR